MIIPFVVLVVLTPLLIAFAVQELVLFPRLGKELNDLNSRRAQRVQQALASDTTATWERPVPNEGYVFHKWIELLPNGTIRVSKETFNPAQPFQVTARDNRNISRATAMCQGDGIVLISSHGQSFVATFRNVRWEVQSAIASRK